MTNIPLVLYGCESQNSTAFKKIKNEDHSEGHGEVHGGCNQAVASDL